MQKKKATNDQENLTDDDPGLNGSNFNNDDESYHSRIVDITTLAKQNQSITLPGHIVMWKDQMTNHCITACLILPSGCSPDDIDAVMSPSGKEVVITYLWPRIMMNPMALHEMYPGAYGTLQYSEGHVKIASFARNIQDLHELINLLVGQKNRRVSSTFKFLLPFAVQHCFTNLENFAGKEVEILDKHSGLKVLLLNLEMVRVFVSYEPQHFQPISVQLAVQPPQQKQQDTQGEKKRKANTIPLVHQSHVGNTHFLTPNAKTTIGFHAQGECGEKVSHENFTDKIGLVNAESGGHKHQKQFNEEMDDFGQSEEDVDV